MAHGAETKRALRSAYVYQSLQLEAAAEVANVAHGTAARWKKEAKLDGDDWDRARAAKMLSANGAEAVTQAVLEQFVILFQSTIESIKADTKASGLAKAEALSRLSDAYNKTMSAARKGSPEVNKLAIGMDVIKLFAEFIGSKYPQHAAVFVEILEPFGQYLSESLA